MARYKLVHTYTVTVAAGRAWRHRGTVYRVSGELVEELAKRRKTLLEKLGSTIGSEGVKKALRDHHARREPIACGMTVHTGIGCSFGCIYCYIPDMGFTGRPRPYPLRGEELAYALLSNPNLVPGPHGTLLAFGSVTEPFMEHTFSRAIEYLQATRVFLSNPTQLATKAHLPPEQAKRVRDAAEDRISILVTIVTLRHAKTLEPLAPPPEDRLATIQSLSRLGVHVSLFLRPLIPHRGVRDDIEQLVKRAAEAGARGVVVGSLRVTDRIVKALSRTGIVEASTLLSRLTRKPRNPRDQVPLKLGELKNYAASVARDYGLKVYPSSCSANIDSHGLACWACKWGPCGDVRRLPRIDYNGLGELAEYFGVRADYELVGEDRILVRVQRSRTGTARVKAFYHWLATLTRRQVVMRLNK